MHPPLFYIHGKDSGPDGYRAKFLKSHFPRIQVPQLTNDIPQRLEVLDKLIAEPSYLVGSSLGGLTSLGFAKDHPERVLGMVLVAPAVGFANPAYRTPPVMDYVDKLVIPKAIPTWVIAGRRDEIIPLSAIEALIRRSEDSSNIPFRIFDEDHLLHSPEALKAQINAIQAMTGTVSAENAGKPVSGSNRTFG